MVHYEPYFYDMIDSNVSNFSEYNTMCQEKENLVWTFKQQGTIFCCVPIVCLPFTATNSSFRKKDRNLFIYPKANRRNQQIKKTTKKLEWKLKIIKTAVKVQFDIQKLGDFVKIIPKSWQEKKRLKSTWHSSPHRR